MKQIINSMQPSIDQSLRLLHLLQSKLKQPNRIQTPGRRLNTQPIDRNTQQYRKEDANVYDGFGTRQRQYYKRPNANRQYKKDQFKHWKIQQHKQEQNGEEGLQEENRRLKRQVNRLMKMNDYLKNQLVKQQHFGRQPASTSLVIQNLQEQVFHLRSVNKLKQQQILNLTHEKNRHHRTSSLAQQQTASSQSADINTIKKKSMVKLNTVEFKSKKKDEKRKVKGKKKPCRLCYA